MVKGENFLKDLLLRADIVEVLSDYITLKRRGKNYVALCPFHYEKKPSFTVSPDKGFYYCFGCGKGGNVIKFLQDHRGMDFREAVVELAERYGLEVPPNFMSPEAKSKKEEKNRIFEINEEAEKHWSKNLFSAEGTSALEHLKSRGLNEIDIKLWKLGYAKKAENSLLNYLLSKGFKEEEILKAGLVTKYDSTARDLFRDRIIFPIMDEKNRILGFAGRSLHGEEPKYLNSPETPVYKKTWTLFGINRAWEEIKREGFAVVVEGYMDVIGMHKNGIKNAVATCGTALTEQHLRILKKLTERIVLMFDGDEGGKNAMFRAIETFLKVDLIPFCVFLPDGYDPDDFVKEKGADAVRSILSSPKDLIEVFIDEKAKDISDIRTKRRRIEEVLSILKIDSPIEREHYMEMVREKFSISKILLQEIERESEKMSASPVQLEEKISPLEVRLLKILLKSREKCNENELLESLPNFSEPTRIFVESLINGFSPEDCIQNLLENGHDPSPYISILMDETPIYGDESEIFRNCLRGIRRKKIEEETRRLQEEIEKCGKEVPCDLIKKKEELIRSLKIIKAKGGV
jgi:DNA primase